LRTSSVRANLISDRHSCYYQGECIPLDDFVGLNLFRSAETKQLIGKCYRTNARSEFVGHSLPNKFLSATVTPFPSGHSDSKEGRNLTGLSVEETIEFEAIDVLDPFDDSGNIAWTFEGEPTTLREKRWLELYLKCAQDHRIISPCFSVPELTRSAGIQFNERVSLRRGAKAIACRHRILPPSGT
jgi:hypothetical protein